MYTTAAARRSLVKSGQYTGHSQTCITFDGNKEVFPLALVQVNTPFYNGEVQCCVIGKPVCYLILGNLPGVLDEPKLLISAAVGLLVGLLTTRARKIADSRPTKSLVTPKPPELNGDHHKLVKLQAEEAAFRPLFAQAECGIVHQKLRGSVCFHIQNGLLFRILVAASGETSQLFVPSSLRERVLSTAHDSVMSGHAGVARMTERECCLNSFGLVSREMFGRIVGLVMLVRGQWTKVAFLLLLCSRCLS